MCRGRYRVLLVLVLSSLVLGRGGDEPESPWKHELVFPNDPFQSWTSPPYVKFTIITQAGYDPNLVYYQDSRQYEFHFDFALENLEPFIGMTIEAFDAVTLHEAGQQAVLGAVILPPWREPPFDEYGIQFVRNDPYSRDEIVALFNRIRDSIIADPNVTAYYFPTYEQYPVAQQNRDGFEARGVPVGSTAQWAEGNTSYAEGWALGTLKDVDAAQIQAAYVAGQLQSSDILLTDGVPAELPSVAGILTLMPSTPNSHVAILARSQGVPFVHLALERDAARARAFVGQYVYLAVTKDEHEQSCRVKLLDVGSLSDTERASLLVLREAPPLTLSPMASRGDLWADTNDLRPADIRFFGGKAANFGILRRAIPDHSPPAMAFSFDLWNAFLDQRVFDLTLREHIDSRLSKYATYPPDDLPELTNDLAVMRSVFQDRQFTEFSPELQSAVLDGLETFGFDPNRKVRFRSSTNVEDSDQFTGAGLYDSFSGCLADDLDGDHAGPCVCDPTEEKERGVFRAIRKVFASFYNDNAFLERLKHGVNEAEVGMALLVHHSFPDDIELANGVATMQKGDRPGWSVTVVSQKGAVSVTNPPMDAVPEEVRIDSGFHGPMPWVVRRSSLVPLREDTVLEWDAEYVELYELLVAAAERYCDVTQRQDVVLDFEFKKVAPEGDLVVKQIREIPQAGRAGYAVPFLLAEPERYQTLQGRGSNVFSNHRLKSRWTLRPKGLWLSEENLQDCIYDDVTIEYVADGQVRSVTSPLWLLPDAAHAFDAPEWEFDQYDLTDSWQFPDLCNPRTYRLRTTPLFQATVPDPVVTLDEMRLSVEVEYEQSVWLDDVQTTTAEGAALYERWDPGDGLLEESTLEDPNTGVSLSTRYYTVWGWGPGTPTSIQFDRTRIEGLTTEPIVLTGYFSQSVGGGAHLCPKNFLFEPALEPGISQHILDELRARNVRLIYYTTGARDCRPTEWEDTPPLIRFYGFDDPIEGVLCDD